MAGRCETPLWVASEGLLAGLGGALAVTGMVAAGRRVMAQGGAASADRLPAGLSAGQALSEGPNMPPDMNRVTATFVQKLATGLFGASLSAEQQYRAGLAWHLAYGGFWGVLYALMRGSVRVPAAILGPALGLAAWAVGPGWLVPRMQLLLPPSKERARLTAMVVGVHAAYGALVALACHLLRRGE